MALLWTNWAGGPALRAKGIAAEQAGSEVDDFVNQLAERALLETD